MNSEACAQHWEFIHKNNLNIENKITRHIITIQDVSGKQKLHYFKKKSYIETAYN